MVQFGRRVLMGLVGVALLVFYSLAAVATYWLFLKVWASRPPLGETLFLVAVLTLAFGYLSYQFGTARILSALDARELPRERAPGLYDRVDRISERMAIESPRLMVAEMALPNALALGSAGDGVVVLDRSLFRLLTGEELAAIITHECAHLESRDSLVQTLAYGFIRTAVGVVTVALLPVFLFAAGLARGAAWIRGRPTRWQETGLGRFHQSVQAGVLALLFVLTLLVQAHSRRREYAADERAAAVTGRPLALARALRKIDRVVDPDWGLRSPLYIRGDEDNDLTRVLSTHPDTDERVKRLVEMARGR